MQNFVRLYEFGVRNEQKYEVRHDLDLKGDTFVSEETKNKIQGIIIQARKQTKNNVNFAYDSSRNVDDSEMDDIINEAMYAIIKKANGVSINRC